MSYTKGPWQWFGSPNTGFYLATTHSGRRYVMCFERMGLQGAQPAFQVKGEGMINARDLCVFEVAPHVVGIEAAKKPGSGVYRKDIIGFDHPDARLIVAAPELLEALEVFAKIEIDCANEIVPNGYESPQTWRDHVLSARAAIAKAKGEVK